MVRQIWVQFQVVSYQRLKKWYLMPPCSTLSIVRYESRVKWSNTGNGVAPFPTPWCISYRKGSLRVTLNNSRQLYLYIYTGSIFECLPMIRETRVQSQVESFKDSKMVLDIALLKTLRYKVRIKGKMDQSMERRRALSYT